MKPKLTKAQKAKAKRAVVYDLRQAFGCNYLGQIDRDVFRTDAEWPEVERLLRVALKAVRGA